MEDMARQLISNADNDEDVEVEVKLMFGKLSGASKYVAMSQKFLF